MLGKDIHLDIDARSSTVAMERRVVERMRNDREAHDLAFDFRDREADSVYG